MLGLPKCVGKYLYGSSTRELNIGLPNCVVVELLSRWIVHFMIKAEQLVHMCN